MPLGTSRSLAYLLAALLLLTAALALQQGTFILWGPVRTWQKGPTILTAVVLRDWPSTLILMLAQCALILPISLKRWRWVCIVSLLIAALYAWNAMFGYQGQIFGFAEGIPDGGTIVLPMEAWQESYHLVRLRLDPSLAIALVIAACTIFFAVVIALRRRAVVTGRCPHCDYDLRGGDGSACPECGWMRAPEE